jgi:hypothetical protein
MPKAGGGGTIRDMGPRRRVVTSPPGGRPSRRAAIRNTFGQIVRAIREGDDERVEHAVLTLSEAHRVLAPLALVVGAFVMLFQALKLLVTDWRLTLVQVLPAMWIWLAMIDLKLHVFKGKSFHIVRGPVVLVVLAVIVAITAASYFLNAAFAFAIAAPGSPDIRRGFDDARAHVRVVLAWGAGIGLLLGLAAIVVPRSEPRWFTLSMSVVVGVMMFTYVTVPTWLLGLEKGAGGPLRRDRLAAATLGGAVGAVVCTPPYVIARIGLLMLGSSALFVPGVVLFAVGAVLQAGATGSVRAMKLGAKIVARQGPEPKSQDQSPSSSSRAT